MLWGLNAYSQNFHYKTNPPTTYFDKPAALQKAGVSNVNSIFKDSRGFMWFGSTNGIYRFDGTNTIYTHHVNDDINTLPDNNVLNIIEDNNGKIWIGTSGGGAILDPYTLKCNRIKNEGNLDIKSKISFFTQDKNIMWAATDDGLYLYIKNKNVLQKFWDGKEKNNGRAFAVISVGFYGSDTLVLGTLTGIIYLNKNNLGFRELPFFVNGKSVKFIVSTLAVDDTGDLWIGTWVYGLLHYNKRLNHFSMYKWQRDIPGGVSNIVSSILIINGGDARILYFSCSAGIFKMPLLTGENTVDENNISLFDHDDKLLSSVSDGVPKILYCDDLDNMWVGLAKETGVNKITITKPVFTPLPVKRDGFIRECQQINLVGKKYFAVSSWHGYPALQVFDSAMQPVNVFAHIPPSDLDPDARNASSVAVDKFDRLWVSSWKGLVVMNNKFNVIKIIDHKNIPDTLSRDKNTYVLIAGDSVWVATYKNGIDFFNLDYKKIGHVAPPDKGLEEGIIWKMFKDSRGVVWLLGNGYFHRYDRALQQFKKYTFSTDNTAPSPVDIAERKDGTLLIATKDGLVHFDPVNDKYSYIRSPLLQKEDDVSAVCIDENDNAYFLTATHLVHYDFNTGNFTIYGKEDGLDIGDALMSIHMIGENKFLVGQQFSFHLFSPASAKSKLILPKAIITTVIVNDSIIAVTDELLQLNLKYYENRLSFNFSAINYSRADQNNYAYRLSPADTGWSYTYNGLVSYANLAPGNYLFDVKVQDYTGVWSAVQSVAVNISPPYWKTWWFISIIVLIAAILFFAIVKYIAQRNLKEKILRLEKEQAIEKERNRISRDMHDELGSGLTKIAVLTEVIKTQPSSADKNMLKISETARALVDNLDEMVWALNPKNDSLDKLAAYIAEYTQQFLENTGIEASVDLPQNLTSAYISEEKRRNVFMTIKEFLNNSVKYSGAKNIYLKLTQIENSFEIIIKDDGKGIDEKNISELGNGIKNMQQRIGDVGGKAILSTETGKGTALHIYCPL